MTNYYDNKEEYERRGIDYELSACLEYNPQQFDINDIERVIAVIEGENDGADWHWLLSMKDKSEVYMVGGCDYTGWDCRSYAESQRLAPALPLSLAVHKAAAEGHWYAITPEQVIRQLEEQRTAGKSVTWREKTDEEFGL